VRHLTEFQARAAIRRGADIEQLLTASPAGVVSWLATRPRPHGIDLVRNDRLDCGTDDFCDVYEFEPMDPESYGEHRLLTCAEFAEAFAAAMHIGARADRWVNEGLIDAEYGDLRRARRHPPID
jgi:hypothetical protein